MSTHDECDYEVGYGKPPKHTRFRKGQSGNPKGRPKGAKGFKASLKQELETKVTIRDGNRPRKISKAEAAAKRLVANAVNGDMKALMMLASFDTELSEQLATAGAEDVEAISADPIDFDILREFLNRPSDQEAGDQDEEQPDA